MMHKNELSDVYTTPPVFENEQYLIRFIKQEDCADLLRVYADKKSVPLFNSDNCGGDDFHYTTMERMTQAIAFWLREYEQRYYVRMTICDKRICSTPVGTIEIFNRHADDFFHNCGLLRLDLRSDYEAYDEIYNLLSLIVPPIFPLFSCNMIATKAIPAAAERIAALRSFGFVLSSEKLIGGHDGQAYNDYWIYK